MAIKVHGAPKGPSGMTVKDVALSSLKPYENNPRKNDPNVPRMVELIKAFGFKVPMLVQGDEIVDGHLRYKAATALGMETVPVIDIGDLPDDQVRALRIVINKSVEWSDWDNDKLGAELKSLMGDGLNLSLTGFDSKELTKLVKDIGSEPLNLNPKPSATKTKQADAGQTDPNYVSLTFHMAATSRDKVMGFLLDAQKKYGVINVSQALIRVAEFEVPE